MYPLSLTAVARLARPGSVFALAFLSLPILALAQEPDYDLAKMEISVAQAVDEVTKADPGTLRFFEDAFGYAVFPNVGKGGLIVGGAHGNGLVYAEGLLIGKSVLKQVDVGLQAGGESYIQVIFFQGSEDLQRFKDDKIEFSGGASAVAIKDGASADIDYAKGVAVISKTKGGLMAAASIGGQKFEFTPLDD